MRLLWTYVQQYKKSLIIALVLAVINQGFSLLNPHITRILIDDYALKASTFSETEFLYGIGLLLIAFIAIAFISRTAKAFQDYFVNVTTESTGVRMYADGVRHIFDLSFSAFENERSGSILLNLEKARDDAKTFVESLINDVFLSVVGIVIVIAYAFYVHWAIAVSFIILIPIVGFTTFFLSKKIKEAQQQIVARYSDLAGSTTETFRNIGLVKSLGLSKQEVDRLNDINSEVLDLEIEKVVLLRKLSFIQGTLVNFVRALLLFVTLYLVWTQDITVGEFTLFLFYTFPVFNPLYNLSTVVSRFQEVSASLQELNRILDLPQSTYEHGTYSVDHIDQIDLEHVSYTYVDSEDSAVSDVSFVLKKGTTTALVGPSGSGKTTIIKLITGLYRPDNGTLKVNGVDTRDVDFYTFRSRLGYVAQDTGLFAGTVRENLQFVRPDATDAMCIEVLKQSSLDYLLERGDDKRGRGLDARIGETGIKLSGGEKQRLAIARSLLRDPDLLIFDEATSALDSLTEKEITKTIETIRKERPDLIFLLIAHRLSTVAHADMIHVFQRGSNVESGNHAQLLEQDGLYRALWKGQQSEG